MALVTRANLFYPFFSSFFFRFANPAIVLPYLLLLKSYSKNTPHTNHCIIRMLHRLAFGLKMDALFFQLSVFHLFNKILNDPAAAAYAVQSIFHLVLILAHFASNVAGKSNLIFSSSQELVTFAKFVINRFFTVAAKNNKAYIELLFWKNVTAAHEMTEGYVREGLVPLLLHDYVVHYCILQSAVRTRRQKH